MAVGWNAPDNPIHLHTGETDQKPIRFSALFFGMQIAYCRAMSAFAVGWTVAFVLLFSASSHAQFSNLTTNRDGRVLYFATDLRQKGTNLQFHSKLYRVDDRGLELAAYRDDPGSSFNRITGAYVSPQGDLIGVILNYPCNYRYCTSVLRVRSEFTQGPFPEILGTLSISANGRFALETSGVTDNTSKRLLNLETGQAVSKGTEPGLLVANNGDVFYNNGGPAGSSIVQRGVGEVVSFPNEIILDWKIDAEGRTAMALLWSSGRPHSPVRLVRVDLRTGLSRQLVEFQSRSTTGVQGATPFQRLQVSEDGELAVVNEEVDGAMQLFAVRDTAGSIAATVKRQITEEPSGIAQFVLSGDGRFVWAISNRTQILKIDVNAGEAREMVGTSVLPSTTSDASPGGRISISGLNLAPRSARATGFPLPESLDGVRVLISGIPMRLEQVSPTLIRGQLSWRTPPGSATFELDPPVSSVFESWGSRFFALRESNPNFMRDDDYFGVVVHGDWRGFVTKRDPAKPGEIVHLFGTGFGPVDNSPPDGEVTPNNSNAQLLSPMTCRTASAVPLNEPVEVLWAGLAPGTFATYQITIRVSNQPPRAPGPDLATAVACRTEDSSHASVFFPVTYAVPVLPPVLGP
jgi:uncharacterized protein (TIGR03437 family)